VAGVVKKLQFVLRQRKRRSPPDISNMRILIRRLEYRSPFFRQLGGSACGHAVGARAHPGLLVRGYVQPLSAGIEVGDETSGHDLVLNAEGY
jgi:hypothetical protein